MPPFVKWLGGKGRILQPLTSAMPDTFTRYVEPMVGGGALFFHLAETGRLRGKEVILNDANEWLMHTYRAVRDSVEDLVEDLRKLQLEYQRRPELLFYEVRKAWNAGTRSEARFIFLKATSFNGLWRVNRQGMLNMPWGHYSQPNICNAPRLRTCHGYLQGVTLLEGNYADMSERVKRGDAVYLDPPYYGVFDNYTAESFSPSNHQALIGLCAMWAKNGVHVVYTHADVTQARIWLRDLWPDALVSRASVRRMINCKGNERTPVYDLIVSQPVSATVEIAI